jgi:hypothetical protein
MGLVTSYRAIGEFDWQNKQAPSWKIDYPWASLIHFDIDSERAEDVGSHDTMYSHLLVVGDTDLSLISKDGDLYATARIPTPPIARPVIGDFNGDGLTDVILVTDDALLGYRLEAVPSTRGLLIAFIILVCFSGIFFTLHLKAEITETKQGKKKLYTMLRSTDEAHID